MAWWSRPRSTSLSSAWRQSQRRRDRPGRIVCGCVAVAMAAMGLTASRDARGQACCASAGLVAPTRLRSYEDFAVGLQGRGRSVLGAFDAAGAYRGTMAGESEWGLEQDLFAAMRVLDRGQVALLLPFIETRRSVPGLGLTGGGIGDLSLSGRYDFVAAGEHRFLPGIALLLALIVPTGTPPEEATDALAAGATGQGSYEGSIGGAVEQAFEPYFVTVSALVTLRSSRRVMGVSESFAPRWTAIVAAGRVLPHGATAGLFLSGLRQGENSNGGGGTIAGSGSSLATIGLASTLSPSDRWRLQGTLFANVPLAGWGNNQTAGAGASISVIRLWP